GFNLQVERACSFLFTVPREFFYFYEVRHVPTRPLPLNIGSRNAQNNSHSSNIALTQKVCKCNNSVERTNNRLLD
ncbi:hypothetical protein QMN21_31610, partial [Serratia sp. Se-PFBMAAmG]|nr:hypothetical protein [Serratia sp. Se-PFBMAAmG]